jgi:hypothetical protein
MQDNKIKYGLHIPLIIVILVIHMLSSDIHSFFSLRAIEHKLEKLDHKDGRLYRRGEYKPLVDEKSPLEVPRDYVYVFVKNYGDTTREIYYAKDGTEVEALYTDGRIRKISGKSGPKTAYFIIPIVGLFTLLFTIIRETFRTGRVSSWQIGRSPDQFEKACYLYGIAFFGIGILIVIVKELWLK